MGSSTSTPLPHHRRLYRNAGSLAAALVLVLTTSACAGDDDTSDDLGAAIDDVEEQVDDISGDVSDAIDEAGEDAVELAARNLARLFGQDEFDDAGHPIDGELTCTADATEGLDAVEIACTGTTEAGEPAALTGTTTELPGASLTELDGDFVGTVADEEVFRTTALG